MMPLLPFPERSRMDANGPAVFDCGFLLDPRSCFLSSTPPSPTIDHGEDNCQIRDNCYVQDKDVIVLYILTEARVGHFCTSPYILSLL